MTNAQTQKLIWLTNRLTAQAMYSREFSYMNGALVFTVRTDLSRGEIMLIATNNTDDRQWFMTSLVFMAIIGPRGGVRVFNSDNLSI